MQYFLETETDLLLCKAFSLIDVIDDRMKTNKKSRVNIQECSYKEWKSCSTPFYFWLAIAYFCGP